MKLSSLSNYACVNVARASTQKTKTDCRRSPFVRFSVNKKRAFPALADNDILLIIINVFEKILNEIYTVNFQ